MQEATKSFPLYRCWQSEIFFVGIFAAKCAFFQAPVWWVAGCPTHWGRVCFFAAVPARRPPPPGGPSGRHLAWECENRPLFFCGEVREFLP